MEVSENVSMIAALDFVRDFLVRQQRGMGKQGDVIMDGRDIGSVVFPDADVKFFMTASLEVRAMRRYKELQQKGDDVSYQEVKTNVEKRDYIDSHRAVSPLKQMPDAVVVDNSEMTLDEELEFMVKAIEHKTRKNFNDV
jgi:cytidylate kinase